MLLTMTNFLRSTWGLTFPSSLSGAGVSEGGEWTKQAAGRRHLDAHWRFSYLSITEQSNLIPPPEKKVIMLSAVSRLAAFPKSASAAAARRAFILAPSATLRTHHHHQQQADGIKVGSIRIFFFPSKFSFVKIEALRSRNGRGAQHWKRRVRVCQGSGTRKKENIYFLF